MFKNDVPDFLYKKYLRAKVLICALDLFGATEILRRDWIFSYVQVY